MSANFLLDSQDFRRHAGRGRASFRSGIRAARKAEVRRSGTRDPFWGRVADNKAALAVSDHGRSRWPIGASLVVGSLITFSAPAVVAPVHAAYREPARGSHGAVAADHELASRAGSEILQRGEMPSMPPSPLRWLWASCSRLDRAWAAGLLGFPPGRWDCAGSGFSRVAPKAAHANLFVDAKTGQVVPERSRRGGLAIGVPGKRPALPGSA